MQCKRVKNNQRDSNLGRHKYLKTVHTHCARIIMKSCLYALR